MNNDELMHYGKMGMKWGKRNAARNAPSKKPAVKKTTTETHESKSRISDADLKSRINRIEMEQKYAKLTAKQTSPGKKMVMDILSTAFKQTAQAYVTKTMGSVLNNMTAPKAPPTPTPNPSSTPSSTVNASTAEPRSSSRQSSSYSRESRYVYPEYRLLN